ncbi:hypothetical protein ACIBPB_19925 [Micromonospora sp. NPDC049836]|uniref:hypothetical protein n=1 Tax=Micromonospora sp. NPDC049836 TaxID=3364274 RepID=UPI00379B9B21
MTTLTPTPRDHRLPASRVWDESSMILPTLVCQVLANACGDLVDVQPSAARGKTMRPEIRPAIRVRPREAPWVDGNRIVGRLLVVTFVDSDDPLIIKPLNLVDRWTGNVLPEYLAGLPGVSMKLRTIERTIIANKIPSCPSYAAHYWSASVTL